MKEKHKWVLLNLSDRLIRTIRIIFWVLTCWKEDVNVNG